MAQRSRLDTAATYAVIFASVAVAVNAVRPWISQQDTSSNSSDIASVQHVDDWESLVAEGVVTGADDALVTIIEFSDFECPFCARFHEAAREVLANRGDSVRSVFVHFPLPMHRFARPAARAAECAEEQGAFTQMKHALYASQDRFGLKAWSEIAAEAGVADLEAFESCVGRDAEDPRVDSGVRAGERLKLRGTPTVLVNGKVYNAMTATQLEAAIDEALARSATGRP
jgi:protein-disulfide isomerase